MRLEPLALASLSCALLSLLAAPARAEATPMDVAVAELAAAEAALASSPPCETMCKALQSMIRAADRICELAREGGPADQKRCADARAKVEEATARVRSACPECNPSPYGPVSKPPEPVPPATGTTGGAASGKVETVDKATFEDAPLTETSARRVTGRADIRTSITLDVAALVAPPWIVQPRFEPRISRRFSLSIAIGLGSLPRTDGGRATAFTVAGEARGYVVGTFDSFGLFVGANVTSRSARLESDQAVDTRFYPVGTSVGGVLGVKWVHASGFTLEARGGADVVVGDRRTAGRRDKVVPTFGLAAGWSF